MQIEHRLKDFYSNANQISLSAIWFDGEGVEHIWYLRPNADFKLVDGDLVVVFVSEEDIHGSTIDKIEIVEADLEELCV